MFDQIKEVSMAMELEEKEYLEQINQMIENLHQDSKEHAWFVEAHLQTSK